MEAKFYDSLHGGDSPNGAKLCMGLTEGDYWARPTGVQLLYKGQSINDIDFGRFEDVSSMNANFEVSAGQPLSRWFYVVRRVNCCGIEEQTLNAAVRIEFDSKGNLVEYGCNKIINFSARQIEGYKVSLRWFYQAIHQGKKIKSFSIYSDNSTGTIDYQNPIGIINYTGRKFYQFITDSLTKKHYKFCIRAIVDDNSSNEFNEQIKIAINRQLPDGVEWICQII